MFIDFVIHLSNISLLTLSKRTIYVKFVLTYYETTILRGHKMCANWIAQQKQFRIINIGEKKAGTVYALTKWKILAFFLFIKRHDLKLFVTSTFLSERKKKTGGGLYGKSKCLVERKKNVFFFFRYDYIYWRHILLIELKFRYIYRRKYLSFAQKLLEAVGFQL